MVRIFNDVSRAKPKIFKLWKGITPIYGPQLRKNPASPRISPTIRRCIYPIDITDLTLVDYRIGQASAGDQPKKSSGMTLECLPNRLVPRVIGLVSLASPIVNKPIWLDL